MEHGTLEHASAEAQTNRAWAPTRFVGLLFPPRQGRIHAVFQQKKLFCFHFLSNALLEKAKPSPRKGWEAALKSYVAEAQKCYNKPSSSSATP